MNCASCGTPLPERALFCPGCGQRMTVQRLASPAGAAQAPAPEPARRADPPVLSKEDVQAAVATRRELGERLEPDVIESFLERVERSLDARIDARVNERLRRGRTSMEERARNFTGRIAASLGIGIPLTLLSAEKAGLPGLVAVWLSIVVLNVYYTETERNRD